MSNINTTATATTTATTTATYISDLFALVNEGFYDEERGSGGEGMRMWREVADLDMSHSEKNAVCTSLCLALWARWEEQERADAEDEAADEAWAEVERNLRARARAR